MSDTSDKISFEVETSRILEILASEIYDSPQAFLRENVQNAYDAVLMRATAEERAVAEFPIRITVRDHQLIVEDTGIGMTEEVLRQNFWRAGSSGKKSELAQRSGVIGTFGIGAMANFGVCTALRVETRSADSSVTLVSSAKRDQLHIAKECIELMRIEDDRSPGTIITADLDPAFATTAESVVQYLTPYVKFLPAPVLVNDVPVSQQTFERAVADKTSDFSSSSSRTISNDVFAGTLQTSLNPQGRVLAHMWNISLNGNPLKGEIVLLQQGGQAFGFRNSFGLAPVPVSGHYGFGGIVNLDILHPTAGREALSRESIQHVANIVALIEAEVSKDVAETAVADQNDSFQQYILGKGLVTLAKNVAISLLPAGRDVPLGNLTALEPSRQKLFYLGRDQTVLTRFATQETNLLHVSRTNPRRALQHKYLQSLGISEVPEKTIVDRIPPTQLVLEEAMFLVRVRSVLLDDYLMADVDCVFAKISHGVAFHVQRNGSVLEICIARELPAVRMVIECYRAAPDVFDGFVKDFVREHLYPQIREHVPSSTRQGRDALLARLKQNKELFKYDETEFDELGAFLSDFLAGKSDLQDVLRSARGRVAAYRQEVSEEQVGSFETAIPDILDAQGDGVPQSEYEAAPPILRREMETKMKVLTVASPQQTLNNFQMFVALSDRAVHLEGDFLRSPHTTKLIWGAHRIIYILTDATGELSFYYDIELKEPLETDMTGGAMFPTTTIVTKDRIYLPVPRDLEQAFRITSGTKEFYVRFDTIP
jgi:molecular chaperone HtpG